MFSMPTFSVLSSAVPSGSLTYQRLLAPKCPVVPIRPLHWLLLPFTARDTCLSTLHLHRGDSFSSAPHFLASSLREGNCPGCCTGILGLALPLPHHSWLSPQRRKLVAANLTGESRATASLCQWVELICFKWDKFDVFQKRDISLVFPSPPFPHILYEEEFCSIWFNFLYAKS